MRCFICQNLSLNTFCSNCINNYLQPNFIKRKLDLNIYSFYFYNEIEDLILTKHKIIGFKIYKALSQITILPFARMFKKLYKYKIYVLGIDEHISSGYSNVAILTNQMSSYFKVLYGKLLISNNIKFSGKSKIYRLNNPRKLIYTGPRNIDIILIDDIVTTGITLMEAKKELSKYNVNILFSLTLATTSSRN